jgi:SAM-dependent methyltransferase
MVDRVNDKHSINVKNFFSSLTATLDEKYCNGESQLFFEISWNHILSLLNAKTTKVLVFGGATALYTKRLLEKGLHVVHYEPSEHTINLIKKAVKYENSDIEYRVGWEEDIEKVEEEAFDLVLLGDDILSYFSRPKESLMKLKKACRVGGSLAANIDSKYYLIRRELLCKGLFKEAEEAFDTGHVPLKYGFSTMTWLPNEAVELFESIGLSNVDIVGKLFALKAIHIDEIEKMLSDPCTFERILQFEIKMWREKSIIGSCGHLGVSGIKLS